MKSKSLAAAFQIILASSSSSLVVALDRNLNFNSKTITGDLKKPVTEDRTCVATESEPVAFTSQAPQFCLVVSG